MTKKSRSESGHYASVYTSARLEKIGAAVQDWFKSLPTPKIEAARSRLGVSQQAVHRWRSGNGGPLPIYMYRLWKDTGNPVFQLTDEETALCLRRGQEIPDDFPTQDVTQSANTSAGPSSTPSIETLLPLTTIEGQMTHNLVILQAFMLALDALVNMNGNVVSVNIRRQAAKLVLQMFRIFSLKVEDFKLSPQEEDDPERRGVIENLLGKVVFAKPSKKERR